MTKQQFFNQYMADECPKARWLRRKWEWFVLCMWWEVNDKHRSILENAPYDGEE